MLVREFSSKSHKTFELFIKARDLVAPATLNPICRLQLKVEDSKWVDLGSTEVVFMSKNPKWKQNIIIDHCFEKSSELQFSIYSGADFIGSIECTSNHLIARQPFISHIFRGTIKEITGTIVVKAEEVRDLESKINIGLVGHHLDAMDFGGKSDPYLIFYRLLQDDSWSECYRTEIIYKTLDPVWKPFEINLHQLCGSDPNRSIKIECFDWDRCSSDDFIGQVTVTLRELLRAGSQFALINHSKTSRKGYTNSGILEVTSSTITRNYSYMDYLQNGTSIKLIVAIDFTSSNGDHTDIHSLHYSNSSIQNEYQRAIEAVIKIIEIYDEDKKIAIFGFGGRPIWIRDISHCFSLTRSESNPYVVGHEKIIETYIKELPNIELEGPTYFRWILEMANDKAREKTDGSIYNVLLIITDGDIDDFPASRDLIVESSRLPMSVIIIGVGGECFSNMYRLDSDSGVLKDHNQREALRDCVQFVPFRQYMSSPESFESKILEEIPSQIESYMKLANIKPLLMKCPFSD
ncbi:unnamed protein product [Blepharisma stoltei]|uniref:Copine-8 n=1 Tax=Blepharisma stoltei TaxID=1481888 RepID=A0AAU9J6N3_9CILI|nr:unnamed protein product [Blepharisma stoltei]